MSLQYGFNMLGWTKRKSLSDKRWTKKHESLSEDDKDFYHNKLCWILLTVDVGHVSKETIPIIIARHKMNPVFNEDFCKTFLNIEYLTKFIGYEVNVNTKTNKEFVQKLVRVNTLDTLGLNNKKEIDTEFVQYCYDVHKRNLPKLFDSYKKIKLRKRG